ncbi:MAG: transporter substrate-binding domain-containing protein [Hyphomicrobiaceae bacterium]|nr:transporter substrate-binding domain-containing protein [Hyphomicrobiaceae bacterium]
MQALGLRHIIGGLACAVALAAAVVVLTDRASAQSAGNGDTETSGAARTPPQRVALRFLTTADFPPFNFYDEDGVLTGFNVDLARAICLELNVTCDVRAADWQTLVPALQRREADGLMASGLVTSQMLLDVEFTERYFHTPGRFAGRRAAGTIEPTPESLDGKRIGVADSTTHAAFVKQFFRGSRILVFDDADAAREALKAGEIDVVFDDGISLSFWLNGTSSAQCCEFKGGPFHEPRYFGDGIAIAVPKADGQLRADLNQALRQVRASGRFVELVTRYFPFRVY